MQHARSDTPLSLQPLHHADLKGWSTLQVLWGVCVPRSQNLSVVSPLPLASWRPSGLKAVASTASVCPTQRHLLSEARPQ